MPDSAVQTQQPFVFDLDAGRACLDFANTRSLSADHLNSYADLLAFASQAELVTPQVFDWLRAEAVRRPTPAQATFQQAATLRDALRRVFLAIANDLRPEDADVAVLNVVLATSLAHACVRLEGPGDAYGWGWSGVDLTAPLWPIVRSAADVLTSEQERPLVRECGASDCTWLFVDSTRNRSRQWCSMTSCGNREKARRHYQRIKANRTGDAAGQGQAADAQPARRPGHRTGAAPAGAASAKAE